MRKFADEQQKAASDAALARSTAETELRASIEAAKAPVASLTAVSADLTTLGKQDSLWDRAKASASFVKCVADYVTAARKDAEATAAENQSAGEAKMQISDQEDRKSTRLNYHQ